MKRMIRVMLVALAVPLFAMGCASEDSTTAEATHDETPATLAAEEAVMIHDDQTRVTLHVTSDGFVPASVHVPAGRPVHLMVTRMTEKTCATELVMAAHNIKQELPLNEAVEITFTPNEAGELRYACGMDMISGTIVVD